MGGGAGDRDDGYLERESVSDDDESGAPASAVGGAVARARGKVCGEPSVDGAGTGTAFAGAVSRARERRGGGAGTRRGGAGARRRLVAGDGIGWRMGGHPAKTRRRDVAFARGELRVGSGMDAG